VKFFLPDWDDRVDPGFDFLSDRFTLVRDPYRDDIYAHELLSSPPYDGLLVSRMALPSGGPKRRMAEEIGMRRYLRLPKELELFGDCGAFGYLRSREPPFRTEDVADYYERLAFDYGVSVDHAVVPEFAGERQFRYDLTLSNAERFLTLHRERAYQFVPVGACQGWDARSYSAAAQRLAGMGYNYIAVGGLARSPTSSVVEVVTAVAESVPLGVRVHVFGVARRSLLFLFLRLGVESVDSAAPLRQAWLSAHDNYYTLERTYTAIRIPMAEEERAKGQTLVGRSSASLGELATAEREALRAVRAYDRRRASLSTTLDAIFSYDVLLAQRLDGQTLARRRALYGATLRARPWKRCTCDVCVALGVEVIVFRGNNRNRRRGFHNLHVLQRQLRLIARGAKTTEGAAAAATGSSSG
jgi:hypothetical protein